MEFAVLVVLAMAAWLCVACCVVGDTRRDRE